MAIKQYNDLNISNLLESLAGLLTNPQACQLLQESRDNIVCLVTTADDIQYICRLSLQKSYADVLKEFDLLRYMQSRQTRTPRPVGCINYAGHSLLVCAFISHDDTLYWRLDVANRIALTVQAGSQLAELHMTSQAYIAQKGYNVDRSLWNEVEHFQKQAQLIATKFVGTIDLLAQALEIQKTVQHLPAYTPTVIHNDFRPNNILRNAQHQILAVIDFDWSCPSGFIVKDLAQGALEWSYQDGADKPDIEAMRSFILGYTTAAKYTIDTAEIIDWMRYSAISDTCSYISYKASQMGTPDNKIESYMYEKFQYLTRYRGQLIEKLSRG